MKKYLFLLLINGFVFGQDSENITHKQRKVVPIIGVNFQFTSYNNYDKLISLNNYQISGGAQLFDRIDIMANVGFLNTQHLINGLNKKLEAFPMSLSLQYRFLKKYWISPSLRCDIAGILSSNLKDKFVNDRLEITSSFNDSEGSYNKIFQNWGPSFSTQLIFSFKITRLYLDVGGGYSLLNFKRSFDQNNSISSTVSGINLYSGMRYTLGKTK